MEYEKSIRPHGKYLPERTQKLRIPDQLDLYMEDGTIYHVRSFFAGELVMGDVLDALTIEKLKRAQ